MAGWVEIRCDSAHYRPGAGGVCYQLLLRAGDDLRGQFEVKCPRCKKAKRFTVTAYETAQVAVSG